MNKDVMKTSEPLVSVVLCFYNEERFVDEAIQSVLSQHYQRWELLLVDDGSTDRSGEIAKRYAARFPDRIFYVAHEYHQNKGLSASRNAGVKKCRGVYVAFLDARDVWLPEKLLQQVQTFNTHPVSVVLEASLHWHSWCNNRRSDDIVSVGVAEGVYKAPELMLALKPLGEGVAPCMSGVMVQRAVLRRCAFEEIFRGVFEVFEDQAFYCTVYLKETVFVSAACYHKYRQPPATSVAEAYESGNFHKVKGYYLYWLRDYLHSQPFRYKAIERRLRRVQMPYREPILYKVTVGFPARLRKVFMKVLMRFGILDYSKSW